MSALKAKAEKLLALHAGPKLLLLPNAWDVASAVMLVRAGFSAIATTSSGVAASLGYPDGQRISRAEMADAVRRIAGHVDVPVSADMEGGYGLNPDAVAETVRATLQAGAVGANIEDSIDDPKSPLIEFSLAVDRIRAAREAASEAGIPFVVNARTDPYMSPGDKGAAAFDEAVRRGNAFRKAGADCIFVPGVVDRDLIARLINAINAPVNILGGFKTPPIPVLESLGVRRVTVGGGLQRATMGLVQRAAEELRNAGTFTFTEHAVPHAEMNKILAR
ncbi:MAG TPA: isocitrate lyase/phosphoenolpyruvate mutase family protein [Alphaproteobacteria bacterium]